MKDKTSCLTRQSNFIDENKSTGRPAPTNNRPVAVPMNLSQNKTHCFGDGLAFHSDNVGNSHLIELVEQTYLWRRCVRLTAVE